MGTLLKIDIKKVWHHFFQHRDIQSRNVLLEHYLHLVKYTAERLHVRFPRFVELEDLQSAGIFGLMSALKNFNPKENIKFETYAVLRIQGAIRDYIRKIDWVPRLVRARAQQLHNATQKLEILLGRLPADTELADELGMDMDRFYHFQRDAIATSLVSLNTSSSDSDGDDEFTELYVISDPKCQNPFLEVYRQDFQDFIKKGLSRQDQFIIILYYFEQMTMKEIGDALGLSESRVCQLHSSIIAKLKGQLHQSSLCLQ
ncbi:MAG: FliA/WhiG family RNA polymerase sigma factor [Anaerohalosphaeraceae bacterium]